MSNPVTGVAEAGLHAVGRAVRQLQHHLGGDASAADDVETRSRWLCVTINKRAEEVMVNGQVPRPLAALGDAVEVEIRDAPGGKGTELFARLRQAEQAGTNSDEAAGSGDDPRQQIRAALREAKQLIEVGDVLKVDPAPHGERRHTPGGLLLEMATKRAGKEGVL